MKKSNSKLSLSLLETSRTCKQKSRADFSDGVFCQVADFFGKGSTVPRCTCSGKSNQCFHIKEWMRNVPYSQSSWGEKVEHMSRVYEQLNESRFSTIDHVYDIIDLQISKKFSVVLLGSRCTY
jgi:hypothetical protein